MDKAAIRKAYKQTRHPMGVYRITVSGEDRCFVGYAVDLQARFNRHKTELRFGSHRNRELQDLWKARGEESFLFEILDELDPKDPAPSNPEKELRILTDMWIEKLKKSGCSVLRL